MDRSDKQYIDCSTSIRDPYNDSLEPMSLHVLHTLLKFLNATLLYFPHGRVIILSSISTVISLQANMPSVMAVNMCDSNQC
jgi:hypothetical protein